MWLRSKFRMTAVLLCCLSFVLAGTTGAQEFPSTRIIVVVPFPPSGAPDVMARLINGRIAENLKQPIIIENRPGAASMLGADYVRKAAPTGYTLLHATATFTLAPSLYPKSSITYDPVKDFQPVTTLVTSSALLLVQSQSPIQSVADLVAAIKKNPRGASYGSAGTGTGNHLLGEMFRQATGLNLLHVPYKGSAPALSDLVGGNFDFMFDPMSSSLGLVRTGKLRALGLASRSRAAAVPSVPTMAEAGLPSVELEQWQGIIAPPGTPREIVARLNQEYAKAVRTPDLQRKIEDQGPAVSTSTPEEFTAQISRERDKLGKLVRDANIQGE